MKPNYDAVAIKANANSIRKKTLKIRLITFISALIILFMAMLFAAINLAKSFGMFTVGIASDSTKAITIYTKSDGSDKTSFLTADGIEDMFNITYSDIPEDIDDSKYEGSHNGENYLAYSFYLCNVGDENVDVIESFEIESMYLNVSDAMRVRIYKEGNYVDYAKSASDGNTEPGCEPFTLDDVIHSEVLTDLEPNQPIRFTVVVWLEGTDPECVDTIRGGSIRLKLTFTIDNANSE